MKIKLICGFRKDQEHTVDAEEAHKAYYLFLNPSARGVFKDGLAIVGSSIQEIVPDYQATMGWYASHNLDSDDWAQIRSEGVDREMQKMLSLGKEIAQMGEPADLNQPISKLLETKYLQLHA